MLIAKVKSDKEIKRKFLTEILKNVPARKYGTEYVIKKLLTNKSLYIALFVKPNSNGCFRIITPKCGAIRVILLSANKEKLIKSFKIDKLIENPEKVFDEIKEFISKLIENYEKYFSEYFNVERDFNDIKKYIIEKIKQAYNIDLSKVMIEKKEITEEEEKDISAYDVINPQKDKIIKIEELKNKNWDIKKVLSVVYSESGAQSIDDIKKIAYTNIIWIKEFFRVSEKTALELLNDSLNYHLSLPRNTLYAVNKKCKIMQEIINTNTYIINRTAQDFIIYLIIPIQILKSLDIPFLLNKKEFSELKELFEEMEKFLNEKYKNLTTKNNFENRDIKTDAAQILKIVSKLYITLQKYKNENKFEILYEKNRTNLEMLLEKYIPRIIKYISDKILTSI